LVGGPGNIQGKKCRSSVDEGIQGKIGEEERGREEKGSPGYKITTTTGKKKKERDSDRGTRSGGFMTSSLTTKMKATKQTMKQKETKLKKRGERKRDVSWETSRGRKKVEVEKEKGRKKPRERTGTVGERKEKCNG